MLGTDTSLHEPLVHKADHCTDAASFDSRSTVSSAAYSLNETSGFNVAVTSTVCLLAAGAVVVSIFAMISAPVILVFVACGICCLNAPTLIIRQFRMAIPPNIRDSISLMRDQVNVLTSSNDFLEKSVDRLQDEVDDLNEVEHDLRQITVEQGYNTRAFAQLVKDNQQILDAMKYNLRQIIVMSMTKLILSSDIDGNNITIHVGESRKLALRLKIQLQPYGIELDSDKFQRMLEEDNSISNILRFCAEILYHDKGKRSLGSTDAELSVEDDNFSDPTTLDTFAQFIENISVVSGSEDEQMTTNAKLGMFTVHSMYSRGSVDVARGARMTVMPRAVRKNRYMRVRKITEEAKRRASISRKTLLEIENKNDALAAAV